MKTSTILHSYRHEEMPGNIERAIKIFWWYLFLALPTIFLPYFHLDYWVYIGINSVITILSVPIGFVLLKAMWDIGMHFNIPGLAWVSFFTFIASHGFAIALGVELFHTYTGVFDVTAEPTVLTQVSNMFSALYALLYAYYIKKLPDYFGTLPRRAFIANAITGLYVLLTILTRGNLNPNLAMWMLVPNLIGIFAFGANFLYDYRILKMTRDNLKGIPSAVAVLNNIKVTGLGGWLIVVGMGLFLTLIKLGLVLYNDISSIIKTDSAYLDITSTDYITGLTALIYVEIIISFCLLLFTCYLIYLYFCKKKLFPVLYVYWLLASVILVVFQYVGIKFLEFPSTEIRDAFNSGAGVNPPFVIGAILGTTIWAAYILRSHRVKNTFVR